MVELKSADQEYEVQFDADTLEKRSEDTDDGEVQIDAEDGSVIGDD